MDSGYLFPLTLAEVLGLAKRQAERNNYLLTLNYIEQTPRKAVQAFSGFAV